MVAYKAFKTGLICLNYQFKMGLNVTDQANCCQNGFHCAQDPLDCLTYYNLNNSEFYIVKAEGDLDEAGDDSKISCTELTILKKLSREEYFLHCLLFIADHPRRKWNRNVYKNRAKAEGGFAIVRGTFPTACGNLGDILALARENPSGEKIERIAVAKVDGKNILPNIWYDIDLKERDRVSK